MSGDLSRGPGSGPSTLRALTLNLWGEQGQLARRLALCTQRIRELQPDVVAFQEVRQIPGKLDNTAATLAAALGMEHVFAPTLDWGGGTEGLAILSRFPIAAQRHVELPCATATERRILLSAELAIPGAGRVAAFCTHLNYRMTHGLEREAQVAAIDTEVRATVTRLTEADKAEAGPGAAPPSPSPSPLVLLMGDFNAPPDSDEMRFLRGLHTLAGRRTYYQDAFLVRSDAAPLDPGYTWSRRNHGAQRLRFIQLDRRIDYVFVSQPARDGRGVVLDCRVVLDAADLDGVFPSDHFGVFAEVQLRPLP